jgi:hypothetical protein
MRFWDISTKVRSNNKLPHKESIPASIFKAMATLIVFYWNRGVGRRILLSAFAYQWVRIRKDHWPYSVFALGLIASLFAQSLEHKSPVRIFG